MKVIKEPIGWAELDAHLVDEHEVDPAWVEKVMTAEEGRELHLKLHRGRPLVYTANGHGHVL